MSGLIEVQVPDIGDFAEVEVIEVLVKPGDVVAVEQSLITVESDKASMEIPSSVAGVVRELRVKVGDKVSKGSVVLALEAAAESASASAPAPAPAAAAQAANASPRPPETAPPAPRASPPPSAPPTGTQPTGAQPSSAPPASSPASAADGPARAADLDCDLLVLGGGPGGYSAAFRAADLGLKVILVERYPTLGGVCLNVGCIPSKALLHVAAVMDETRALAAHGIAYGEPTIDLDGLRGWKDKVVGKLTAGLAGMARARKTEVLRGLGSFVDDHHVEVELTTGTGQDKTGERKVVRFAQAIIAVGSQAVRLPFLPDDTRVVDSTGALALASRPARMLVIGGGIIGLEMGTVYSTLGASLDVVEMLDGLMTGADRDLVRVWQKFNQHRFGKLMLRTRTTRAQAEPEGIRVWFEGENAPPEPQLYDLVLSAVGRSPNGAKIGAERAGVKVGERGFIAVDKQMRTNVPHILAIGDVVGQPMLAHKAVHEGHVAAEVAAGHKAYFDARVIPSVAYTDPEVAWVGLTEEEAKATGVAVRKGLLPWAASGRAIANGRDEGFTKLLFDQQTGRIVGGGIVGTHAGDLISEIALAIEMGADSVD
ncbi:MAG TPA: dihydrolipoyl dehydrogenase, partial [Burkholderiaceae bacterium]|nr:dihydrolipoyl dehydrogenase [Burkholderiaceae bacterium]